MGFSWLEAKASKRGATMLDYYYPWGSEPLISGPGNWCVYVVYPFGMNGYIARGLDYSTKEN
jgi:hypothetical protein